ncbi:MAG: NAD(P)/FAD-dependent oxidoreductase [Dehalococcoidia bacterium]|nr:MAG: NAD(P)/FAD-dependent oxidoreductase [Dehalococcoidia bacterium]
MSDQVDITIGGAGVIGLAIASQVAREGREVYVLEKNETFGREASSRNSEVIHSGIYYPKDSLKAKTCVEGNALLYELCQKHAIGHRRIGKIIVATDDAEVSELENLWHRGKNNGVKGLRMLSRQELRKLEPNVRGIAAIFSPSTGIIDSWTLMSYFMGKARDNGAHVACRTKVIGIDRMPGGCKVSVEDRDGYFCFATKVLINCAGLHSDEVAEMVGIDLAEAGYKLHYCRGEYFSVGHGKSKLVSRLIYPVPKAGEPGLGIHVNLDLGGRMRLGPNASYVDRIDYELDESQKRAFYDSAARFLPFIEYDDLEPEMVGIRAKLDAGGEDFRDFVISHEYDRGLPEFINLIGIESPGLTSAPAIARYVGRQVEEVLSNC